MQIAVRPYEIADQTLEDTLERMVGPQGKWRETRDVQLGMIERLGIQPDMSFADIGCGTLRAGLPLIGFLDAGKYFGIDVNDKSIALGKDLVDRFALTEKAPTLLHSTTFGADEISPSQKMDRIWSYQVAIHLFEDQVRALLTSIAKMLASNGKAWVSVIIEGTGNDFSQIGDWSGFPVSKCGSGFFKSASQSAGLSFEVLGTLGDYGLPQDRGGAGYTLVQLTKLN